MQPVQKKVVYKPNKLHNKTSTYSNVSPAMLVRTAGGCTGGDVHDGESRLPGGYEQRRIPDGGGLPVPPAGTDQGGHQVLPQCN